MEPADPVRQFQQEVADNIDKLATARDLHEQSLAWLRDTLPYRYSYNFTWLGRPIIQYPQDVQAIQELIWRVRPDLVIETGIAHGGSLILSASMLALLDYADAVEAGKPLDPRSARRRVVGIDIDIRPHNRAAIESHPLSHRIDMIEGSSVEPGVVARVHELARKHERILVCLDSNHTGGHVLAELKAYAPLVSPGSYCVVFDTVIERLPQRCFQDRPWCAGNSPMTAVNRFLSMLERGKTLAADGDELLFEIDARIDAQLLISVAPSGYLRRVQRRSSDQG